MYVKKLIDLGINPGLTGFRYLVFAFDIYRIGDSFIDLYDVIGEHFDIDPRSVARAISQVIKRSDIDPKLPPSKFISLHKVLFDDYKLYKEEDCKEADE